MANILNLIRNDYRNAYRPNGKKVNAEDYWDRFLWNRLGVLDGNIPSFQGYDVVVMEENITDANVSNKNYYAILKFSKNSEEHYVRFPVWWDSWGGYDYDR